MRKQIHGISNFVLALCLISCGSDLTHPKHDAIAKFEVFSSYAVHQIEFVDDAGTKHRFNVKYLVQKDDVEILPSLEIIDGLTVVVRDVFKIGGSPTGDIVINWTICFDPSGADAIGTLFWEGRHFFANPNYTFEFELGQNGFVLSTSTVGDGAGRDG